MKPLSALSSKILRKPSRMRGFAEISVLAKWSEIFPSYAKFMRPISLKKGVLRVATNSGSAANNLQMQGPYLLARINQYFGYNAVKDIKYVIRYFSPQEEPNKKLLTFTDEGLKKANKKCMGINDLELRKSFANLSAIITIEKNKKVI